jgi:nitroreductase
LLIATRAHLKERRRRRRSIRLEKKEPLEGLVREVLEKAALAPDKVAQRQSQNKVQKSAGIKPRC